MTNHNPVSLTMKKQITPVLSPTYLQGSNPGYADVEQNPYGIVENDTHAFFLTLADGSIIESNIVATKIFGYSATEFKKLKRWHIIDHSHPVLISALQMQEKRGFTVTEATGITKNGVHLPIEISSATFTDVNGAGKCSIIVSDISIRKKVEAALLLHNEKNNLAVKTAGDISWVWDLATGDIFRSGNNFEALYGYNEKKLPRKIKDLNAYIHPLDKEKITAVIDYYIKSTQETDFSFEYRFKKEDGAYVYLQDKGYIIRNPEGKAIRMIGTTADITERKQTELAIEESEQRYKNFVQLSTEGIWRIELKQMLDITAPLQNKIEHCFEYAYIAECNDAYAQMYGFAHAAELVNIPLHKLWPKENALSIKYVAGFIRNGFKATEEISYEYNRDGEQVIFLNTMLGIVEGNFLCRVWGTRRNITAEKKAEKALADSENHLRTIVQTNPECIKLIDKEGVILEMNPAGFEMLEADNPEQVIGNNVLTLVMPEYHKAFKALIQDVFNGNSAALEFEIIGLKGKQCVMETNCVPLRDTNNIIISVLSVTHDITDRKNEQALLLASEERYRYLFNHSPSNIILWDMNDYSILEVNDSAINLYGYTREEFLQKSILDIRVKDEHANAAALVKEAASLKDFRKSILCKTISKDGTKLFMDLTVHKITYKGKQVILSQGNNITEKIQLENSLNEERQIRQQQVTEAVITGQEKERTEIGEELHDNINQILASTKLYIECAMKDATPRADLMQESKLLLEKAMKEIRNLSKALLPPSLGEMGLLQALHELVENINQVNDVNIAIKWNDTEDEHMSAKLKLTIFRIIQEQLSNVIKHANAANVTITIHKKAAQIRVSVKDDGRGFDTSLKRNGVGLRNISSRAEVNNGTVSIISKPGKGCELKVTFTEKVHAD